MTPFNEWAVRGGEHACGPFHLTIVAAKVNFPIHPALRRLYIPRIHFNHAAERAREHRRQPSTDRRRTITARISTRARRDVRGKPPTRARRLMRGQESLKWNS